jgi:CheY-like chemotaxis protein
MPHTLLLADDSVTIQRVIELTFADEDIRVVSVGDGQQAIDRIRAEPPDIVLADTGMPERDGYEVAAFIKTDPDLASIPVVLLTGAFEPVDGDRAKEAGCDAVLVKPFEPQVVIKRVRALLANTAAPAEPVATSESADVQDRDPDPALAPPQPVVEPKADETLDFHRPPQEDAATPVELPATEGLSGEADPLGAYLDRVDEALDRLESGDPPVEPAPAAATPTDDARPLEDSAVVDSLEGALSALEGALDKLSLEPVDPVEAAPTADDGNAAESAGESLETPDDSSSMSPSDTERVSEPAAEPTFETAPALVTDPVSEPVVESAAEAVVEPVVEPVIESAVDAVVEPVPEPLVEPAPESDLPGTEFVLPPDVESVVQDSSVASDSWTGPAREAPRADPWSDRVVEASAPPEPAEPAHAAPPVPAPPRPVTPAPPPAAGPTPPRAAPPSLADAFASLLAAEQGDADRARALYPWAAAPTPAGADEELIERVTERVLARLSDTVSTEFVTQVVARVAERLVRAELDRLKQ